MVIKAIDQNIGECVWQIFTSFSWKLSICWGGCGGAEGAAAGTICGGGGSLDSNLSKELLRRHGQPFGIL